MKIIDCRNVSKIYHRHAGQLLLRSYISGMFQRRLAGTRSDKFYALRDVSFTVNDGESIAVIGANGAGKSTLLSIVSGLSVPDEGDIDVRGRVAPLLTLGAGFHPDLTGAENLYLNASLLGFDRRKTRALFNKIVEFAGIEEFINEPLRTYSSGMGVRLAFSIAANLDPDVLVVDEVLAVGDQDFQTKCQARIRELRERGTTFFLVTHAMSTVRSLCDRALWLEHGRLVESGPADAVVDAYTQRSADVSVTAGV